MARDIKELKEGQKKTSDALMDQLRIIQDQLRSMEGLRKDVEGLKTTVQAINTALELMAQQLRAKSKDLEETQAALRQVRDELERTKAETGKMHDDIKAKYSARCDALTEAINNLKQQMSESTRQAARMTEGTGTIRLFNTYAQPVSIVVNKRSYQLDPGASFVLANQPVGQVTYEVIGLSAPVTRTLTPDRALDIEVYDLTRGPVRTPPPTR
jgi:hypothetical protein